MRCHPPILGLAAWIVLGCAPDTTCPASVRFSTDPVGLAASFQTLPLEPTEVSFTGRVGDVLSFAGDLETFEVTTAYGEWAPLVAGQRVLVWSDGTEATTPTFGGQGISFFVADPETGALLFGIVASNGQSPLDGARTFGDLAIDYELACTAPPVDCTSLQPAPVDGERLVASTATSTVRIERGDTREVDGFRIYLQEASRPASAVFPSTPCDVSTGRGPRRGVVIARIE